MNDAIIVVIVGLSSLRSSVLDQRDGTFEPLAPGQAEGLYTAPRFGDADGCCSARLPIH
jgi:hypothetical protein